MSRNARFRQLLALCLVALTLLAAGVAAAEPQHRATRLGNPATRFAEPVTTPEALRSTLLRESLRDDVNTILRMSDYLGHFEDFRAAVANAEILEISIPVGSVLPAMSTRRQGRAALLRNVLWAGKAPIEAYEFSFISGERRYRVVTPKACSNFWVEEQLPRPAAVLALRCEAAEASPVRRALTVCNTLVNNGELVETRARLVLPIPAGVEVDSVLGEARVEGEREIVWQFDELAPGAQKTACAIFVPTQLGRLVFDGAASGERADDVAARCETGVYGIPAVLLRVIDIGDPVEVGNEVTYEISVLNQGSLPLTNLRFVVELEAQQGYVRGAGDTALTVDGGRIASDAIAVLEPGGEFVWRIVVKALAVADARFNVVLRADQFARPVTQNEATNQY